MARTPVLQCLEPKLIERSGSRSVYTMVVDDRLIGRPGFLHGGAIGAMFEAAISLTLSEVLSGQDAQARALDMSIEYLRGGALAETWVEVSVVRAGFRIVNMGATAWQEDPGRPIARCRMMFKLERPTPA